MKSEKRLLLGWAAALTAISALSVGLSISWTPGATVAYLVVPPAHADDDNSNGNDDGDKSFTVKKAHCAKDDTPETGLQGQIPMPDRLAGFKGFNCNLELTTSTHASRGDGYWSQFAYARDRAGHVCGYAGSAYLFAPPGTVVIDLTDPNHSVQTTILTTPAMTGPGEGIRAHTGRGLLVSGNYRLNPDPDPNAHGFDVYDIGTDCRYPQLLYSSTSIAFDTTGLPEFPNAGPWPNPDRIYGHEGAISPDGMTFYLSDYPHGLYHAIDISDPRNPKLLASFQDPFFSRPSPLPVWQGVNHGLSISTDGKRGYFASIAFDRSPSNTSGATPATGLWTNGFVVVDTSEIQARKPNPKMRVISTSYWNDGAGLQMTIPVTIKGRHYLITSEESGSGQLNTTGYKSACAAGRTLFGMARIHDIEDERSPKLVTKIMLETNDPKNCGLIAPEIAAPVTYDIHMCSVDNREDATTLACSYFNSGIRVYDIRNPKHVKEIAYYNPAANTAGPGAIFGPTGPKWCGAIPFLDAKAGMLYSTCADSGIVSLKFRNNVWPFEQASTPRDKQL
jgi:hypothetical protein